MGESGEGTIGFLLPFIFSFTHIASTDTMAAKNVFGLFSLIAPFAWLLINQIAPDLVLDARKTISSRKDVNQQERICYHEAGHFIVGYLSGLRTKEYDISGDIDSGTRIDSESNLVLGNLLTCALAGCVAETLRFGDSSGGKADISMAHRLHKVPTYILANISDT